MCFAFLAFVASFRRGRRLGVPLGWGLRRLWRGLGFGPRLLRRLALAVASVVFFAFVSVFVVVIVVIVVLVVLGCRRRRRLRRVVVVLLLLRLCLLRRFLFSVLFCLLPCFLPCFLPCLFPFSVPWLPLCLLLCLGLLRAGLAPFRGLAVVVVVLPFLLRGRAWLLLGRALGLLVGLALLRGRLFVGLLLSRLSDGLLCLVGVVIVVLVACACGTYQHPRDHFAFFWGGLLLLFFWWLGAILKSVKLSHTQYNCATLNVILPGSTGAYAIVNADATGPFAPSPVHPT